MGALSKLLLSQNAIAAATSTAFSASFLVAVNSTRKRRREGGGDVIPVPLGVGGRGGTRPHRKAPDARYSNLEGKKKWMLRPDLTQFHYDYIVNADLARDPSSKLGRLFKAKFRISFQAFEKILEDTMASEKFAHEASGKRGQKAQPLAMKVMAALRRLALGIPVDGLEDMVGIGSSTLQKFIPEWEDWFIEKYYDDTIKVPEGPAIHAAVDVFQKCGLPGFISSMDVVHVRYDRCPYRQRPNHKGKEGYPTVAYQVHVGHNGEIYWLSPEGFPGARNDKTVVMYDYFLKKISKDPDYKGYAYELYVAPGEKQTLRGVHSLCDGGYHQWLTTICGFKHADEKEVKAWSSLCESVRKDVECVFGILKKRFRVLATSFLNHDSKAIDRTFKVCCILHNMCCKANGLSKLGAEAKHWRKVDKDTALKFGVKLDEVDVVRVGRQGLYDMETLVDDGFHEKRMALIKHYIIALHAGEVYKLKTMKEILEEVEAGTLEGEAEERQG